MDSREIAAGILSLPGIVGSLAVVATAARPFC
jgi:hypothetical protein